MEVEKEINSLCAETIALQTILVHTFRALVARDPSLKPVLEEAFGNAISQLDGAAIHFGPKMRNDHLLEATKIADKLWDASLGGHTGPQNGV